MQSNTRPIACLSSYFNFRHSQGLYRDRREAVFFLVKIVKWHTKKKDKMRAAMKNVNATARNPRDNSVTLRKTNARGTWVRKLLRSRFIMLLDILLLSGGTFAGKTVSEGDFAFSCNEETGKATLINYNGSNASVEVPSTVSFKTTEYVYDSHGNPEYDDKGNRKTKTVTHSYDVTSISSAFSRNVSVSHITLPSSVKSLGNAFYGCSALKSVNLNYVATIGDWTFQGCTSLEKMDIPPSVMTIGGYAFAYCSGLTSVTIPSSVTNIGGYAFSGCTSLTSIETPDTLRHIGAFAFSDCTSLKRATLMGTDLDVAGALFMRCTALEYVVIGQGISSIADGWSYDDAFGMFSHCTNLKTVEILTDRVKYLPKYMFYRSGIERLILSGGFEEVGAWAFIGCSKLESIEGPFAPVSIGCAAFSGCGKLKGNIDFSNCTSLGESAFSECSSLNCTINLTQMKSIGFHVFANCAALENVEIPNVENIGSSAFSNCSSLKTVNFSQSLTNIDTRAFSCCSSMRSVELPKSLKYLGTDSFQGCSGLKSVKVDGDDLVMASSVFRKCLGLEEVVIGPGVVSIAQGNAYSGLWDTDYYSLFEGCASLKTVDIQSTKITFVQKYMFRNSSVQKVKFAGVISTIYDYAFYGCSSLKSLEGEIRPYSIRTGAFQGCRNFVGGIDFSRCTSIAGSAFEGCRSLSDILCLPKVREIKSYSFRDCTALTGVELPLVRKIESWAFNGCTGIKHIELSSITNLEGECFSRCRSLTDLEFPASLKYLGARAFGENVSLTNVSFAGEVPTVGSTSWNSLAFYGCNQTAQGKYPSSYALEWEAVIDPTTKKWQGLIMAETPSPKLVVDAVSWPDASLTLSWGKMTTGAAVTVSCSLYRGTSDDIAQATCILKDSTATAYADAEFLDVQPRTAPLYYWVVPQGGDLSSASAPVKTRNRIGVFVGYDAYKGRWQRPLKQALSDAAELRRLCVEKGGFSPDNARLLSNSGARMQDIRDAFANCAEVSSPGDMFVFYIATHGGGYSSSAPAYLCAYDAKYPVSSFLSDIREFPPEVAVVAIIMACHSESMTGSASSADSAKSWVDNWLAQCGFAQCLGNVAWISSCASSESSYNSRDYSLFGQSFVRDGLRDGYADVRLFGVGFGGSQYNGGNLDGAITFGELGRYAGAFATGLSDRHVSSVQLENEPLLDRICVREGVAASPLDSPAAPTGVSASQGMFDQKIQITWDASDTATGYRVYRYPTTEPSSAEWVGSSVSCSYDDKEARVKEQFAYRIRAVNQVGLSDLSLASMGNRGSESYLSYLANLIGSASALISASDYDAKEKSLAANGCRTVGECYATGVDPQDPDDDLKIKSFEMKDGKPVITLNHTKDGAGNSLESRIRMLGKEDLSDMEWVDITDTDKSPFRFFRMKVDLP